MFSDGIVFKSADSVQLGFGSISILWYDMKLAAYHQSNIYVYVENIGFCALMYSIFCFSLRFNLNQRVKDVKLYGKKYFWFGLARRDFPSKRPAKDQHFTGPQL